MSCGWYLLAVKFSHYPHITLCKFPPEEATLPNFCQRVAPQYSPSDKILKQQIACNPRDYCIHGKLQFGYFYQHYGVFCIYAKGNTKLQGWKIGGLCCWKVQWRLPICSERINPSAWRHLNPSSYCDVGRLFRGYLNYGLNCREKNEEIISRNSLPHYKRASSFTNKREAA